MEIKKKTQFLPALKVSQFRNSYKLVKLNLSASESQSSNLTFHLYTYVTNIQIWEIEIQRHFPRMISHPFDT